MMAAWRMKLQLPKFKATLRTSTGAVTVSIPRGRKLQTGFTVSSDAVGSDDDSAEATCQDAQVDVMSDHGCDNQLTDDQAEDFAGANPDENYVGPSLHEIKQKANVSAWEEVRPRMLSAVIESSSMTEDQQCILCPNSAEYRCTQCAAWAYYCGDCFGKMHLQTHLFHTGEVWKESQPTNRIHNYYFILTCMYTGWHVQTS